ncbi:RNI-like protein, partial [Testicularia cyperi]
GPSHSAVEASSSLSTSPPNLTVSPVRRSVYKRKMDGKPKGILKPAPPPQKGFSFRRDILQTINTRLAQQGVNVQVPVPQGSTAQATASYIGGMFRKIGGMAAGAAANVSGSSATSVGGFLSNDYASRPGGGPSGTSSATSSSSVPGASRPTADAGFGAPQRQASVSSQASDSTLNSLRSASTTPSSSTISAAPLKKVQFRVSHMTVTYPIAGAGTPEDEDLTRLRIEREHRRMLKARKGKAWTPEELESLYRECCRTREEHPLKKMRLVFQEAAQSTPPALKTMDLSFVPLDRHAVEPIADLLSVDFGLNKLVLENCALTDESVKSILHALLVSGTLPNLSLASNRKIRYNGWRYVAIFMRRARALRYLDLSENSINRPALEQILQAIAKSPEAATRKPAPKAGGASAGKSSGNPAAADPGEDGDNEDDDDEFFDNSGEPLMPTAPLLRDVSDDAEPPTSAVISLRLENCGLKAAALEMLSHAVRFSDVRHLSLRRNKINQLASVALAIMLKDYPDSLVMEPTSMSTDANGEAKSYFDSDRALSNGGASGSGNGDRSGRTLKPVDPSSTPDRRQRSYSPSLPEVPVIVSSPGGGVTSRRMPHQNGNRNSTYADGHTEQLHDAMSTNISSPTKELDARLTMEERLDIRKNATPNMTEEQAIAIYQAKRARRILADLPRVGNLLTLDLKSNDIRGGVVYLAQVLKKNRTLRVLNLSDNSIEVPGLVVIAEALKYNSTLETLDMSHNPCCGPGLEGITTLRTAFALNSNLKRLFLNDTDLSSEAAIALAEFLPEARSLIHLDLAENFEIDIAGVMALAVSLRMNKSLRCLDLNIPANNPDFARLSQEILQICVRNTELAQQKATQKGLKQPIAAPIYKSVVARAARENDERLKAVEAARTAALAAAGKDKQAIERLLAAAGECRNVLKDLLEGEEKRQREAPEQKVSPPGDFVEDLTKQSKNLRGKLGDLASTVEDEALLERVLSIHDELADVTTRLEKFYRYAAAPMIDVRAGEASLTDSALLQTPNNQDSGLSSPSFSIADSDESDDDASENETAGSTSVRRRKNGKSSGLGGAGVNKVTGAGSAIAGAIEGLRIDTGDSTLMPAADREEPEDGDDGSASRLAPRSPSEDRAKGQLSEEAELFRKARSLGLDDVASAAGAESDQALQAGSGSGKRRGSSSSTSPASHSLHLPNAADLSGEELRKDLLETDVPPKS